MCGAGHEARCIIDSNLYDMGRLDILGHEYIRLVLSDLLYRGERAKGR
jgi:hypothetical protein